MKRVRSAISKRLLIVSVMMLCLFSLAFGAASVQAASLKSTAKKEITSVVKKQYSTIKKYAKKTNFEITSDKKAGKLKKAGKNYSQEWKISMAGSKSGIVLSVKIKNTYVKKTKKVKTVIHADVQSGEIKVGDGEDLKSVSALKKLMKKLSTPKGAKSYTKKFIEKNESSFEANKTYYCKYCRQNCYGLRDYISHNLMSYHIANYFHAKGWW